MNRTEYKNQHRKEHYDTILFAFPKGEKWQVPRKYHDMIEDLSYTKDEGYFIYLKEGYVNDVTGSRSIHCEKTSEVRRIIGKTHRK